MKSFKISILFIALGIVIFSAFAANVKTVKKNKAFSTYYYSTSAAQDIAHLSDPVNWFNTGTSCGATGNDVCTMNYG
ncbi:MAG TPA: hypothetical protein VK498_16035, partial [Ferruginibacter sp.]|nr:hypothetical protein [Ferruginibacter sp.]